MPPTTPSGKLTGSSSAAEPFCSSARCGLNLLASRTVRSPIATSASTRWAGRRRSSTRDLNYSPREGEVRTYLTDWANYRYTISRDTIAKKYPLNYYFLSQALASQLMTEDNQNHLVSQVVGRPDRAERCGGEERHDYVHVARRRSRAQRSRAERLSWPSTSSIRRATPASRGRSIGCSVVTYYLNPKQVSDQAKIFPQFETINPLGLTITEFHENRMSVDPIAPGTTRRSLAP